MPKQMTKEERAAYQRDYRARKKREALAMGLIETRPPEPVVEFAPGASGKSWESAEAVVAATPQPAPQRRVALTLAQRIAAGLAAPDDDCATCGHDRQTTHPMGGRCGHGCPCRRFRPAGSALVPCHGCGHDEWHGHAATPCDEWAGGHPCGCPAFVDPEELF